ncbi:MAG TPA: serine/threonine-protein kinase [Actinoplanes sp.]|nr:serine/threonine-protein kinase [Actinoplanes sp.]
MLSSGHLLDNRYRLDERIATGGMGDVWRGTDVVLGRVVAVKVLRPAMLADPEFAARFYGEARMMAAFRHPGVVEVYDYANATDSADQHQCAYLVMAYVEGEPLSTRLKEAGRLGVTETMSIVAQAADALHAAHQNGTVHRDVKPGNLIVKPNGTVILVDFGVARSAQLTSVTGLNAIVGTALYMAPEQVAKGNVSPATDIYALGAVAYHCLAGHPPFEGDNALQVALRHLDDEPEPLPDDVPEAVRALISQAMAKDPIDRYGSAAAFADAALEASGTHEAWPSATSTALISPSAASAASRSATAVNRGATNETRAVPASPPATPRRNQLWLLGGVLALLVVAVGLVLAMAMNALGDGGSGPRTDTPPATPWVSAEPSASLEPTPPAAPTRVVPRPNWPAVRPSSAAPTGSVQATTTATPTPKHSEAPQPVGTSPTPDPDPTDDPTQPPATPDSAEN